MKGEVRSFRKSLVASTVLAFGSLAVSYWWANQEIVGHIARKGRLLYDLPFGVNYESMTIGLAIGVSLVVGLIGFSLTAILGISRRPWGETALVLAPACVWLMSLLFSFVCLSEWYFP